MSIPNTETQLDKIPNDLTFKDRVMYVGAGALALGLIGLGIATIGFAGTPGMVFVGTVGGAALGDELGFMVMEGAGSAIHIEQSVARIRNNFRSASPEEVQKFIDNQSLRDRILVRNIFRRKPEIKGITNI